MAGSSSNWYRPTKGPLKGQSVYIDKAQRTGFSRAQVLKGLNQGTGRSMIAANFKRPKAAAKSGGVKPQTPAKPKTGPMTGPGPGPHGYYAGGNYQKALPEGDQWPKPPDATVTSNRSIRTRQVSQRDRSHNLHMLVKFTRRADYAVSRSGPRGFQVIDARTGDPAVHPTRRNDYKTLQGALSHVHEMGKMFDRDEAKLGNTDPYAVPGRRDHRGWTSLLDGA